jgi:hypothetical protein
MENRSLRIESETKLIGLVREKKSLWKMDGKCYKDINRKAAAWIHVAEVMDKTVNEVNKSWTQIRSYYMRIKRSTKKRLISGSAAADSDSDSEAWPHFNALKFLDPVVEERSERSSNVQLPLGQPVPALPQPHGDSFFGLDRTALEEDLDDLYTPNSSSFDPMAHSSPMDDQPSTSAARPAGPRLGLPAKKAKVDNDTLRQLVADALAEPMPTPPPQTLVSTFAAFCQQMLGTMPPAIAKNKMAEMTKILFK